MLFIISMAVLGQSCMAPVVITSSVGRHLCNYNSVLAAWAKQVPHFLSGQQSESIRLFHILSFDHPMSLTGECFFVPSDVLDWWWRRCALGLIATRHSSLNGFNSCFNFCSVACKSHLNHLLHLAVSWSIPQQFWVCCG